jgi:hypothetical protein
VDRTGSCVPSGVPTPRACTGDATAAETFSRSPRGSRRKRWTTTSARDCHPPRATPPHPACQAGRFAVTTPVRLGRRIKFLGVTVKLTTVEIYAIQVGAALSAIALWFLPGFAGFLGALGMSVAAAVAVRIRWPAPPVRREREVKTSDLRPGDWVRLASTGRAAGIASQVVAVITPVLRSRRLRETSGPNV